MIKYKKLKNSSKIIKIKVWFIREHHRKGNQHLFKDKKVCIRIEDKTNYYSSCFPPTRKGSNDLLKFIRENINLK